MRGWAWAIGEGEPGLCMVPLVGTDRLRSTLPTNLDLIVPPT